LVDALALAQGAPRAIRVDDEPDPLAQPSTQQCASHSTAIRHIQPGTPDQNACIERFNRTYRTELLDAHLESLEELRALTDA
jgi:putative transposase